MDIAEAHDIAERGEVIGNVGSRHRLKRRWRGRTRQCHFGLLAVTLDLNRATHLLARHFQPIGDFPARGTPSFYLD